MSGSRRLELSLDEFVAGNRLDGDIGTGSLHVEPEPLLELLRDAQFGCVRA
jgi:hypothetical protein